MRKDIGETTVNTHTTEGIIVSHLLHPTAHFKHPEDVLAAEHLDKQEKRAILASWASDQYAVESVPALRYYPGSESAVTYDEIISALKRLDGDASSEMTPLGKRGSNRSRLDFRYLLPMKPRYRMFIAKAK